MVGRDPDGVLEEIATQRGPTAAAARAMSSGGGDWSTIVLRQTAAQTPRPGQPSCPGAPGTHSFTVNAANLSLPDIMRVAMTGRGQSQITPPATSTTFTELSAGVSHVLAFAGTPDQAFRGAVQQVTIPGGPISFDRNSMPSVVNATATLTGKPAGMMVSDHMSFGLSSGIAGPYSFGPMIPNTSSTRTMFRHSTAGAGDFYGYGFSGFEAVGTDNDVRSGTYYFSTFGNQSFAVPPAVPSFTTTQIGTGPDRFRVSGTIPPEFMNSAITSTFTGTAALAVGNFFSILTTAEFRAAAGGGSTYVVDIDAFSGGNFPAAAHLVGPLSSTSVGMGAAAGTPSPGNSFMFSLRSRTAVTLQSRINR
jgi:hypothetical protein